MTEKLHKMQSVSFRIIEDFLEYLPENELKIVQFLRNLVLDCVPGCKEKLSYNVPYYRRHYTICFIWPASVTWGSKITYQGVRMGFTNGNLLANDNNYLDKGNRKQVYWKDYSDTREINVPLLKSCLFDAVYIDEERAKIKRTSQSKINP